jgi:type I restriction enzyme S subunit
MRHAHKNAASNEEPKPSLVPRLRFPEFAGEWEAKHLGDQGEFLASLSGKTGRDFDVGEAKFITYMNVFANTFVDPMTLRFVDVKVSENQNAVAIGDVFFTISSETPEEVGMSSVLLEGIENCYLNSFCALFRFSDSRRPNPVFTGYMLRQPIVRDYFAKKAQGSTRFNLSKDAFRSLLVLIPSLPEQQRIASCLSSLDELITAQARKVDALKTHKKGLMQQLFPREGETLPRLRFPEFEGEWEERRLGDVATFHKGKGISKADISTNGRTPCIRYGELYTVYGEIVENVQSRTDIPVDDLFLSQSNDVIIPASGETRLDIAKAACVIHDDVALGGDLNVIRTSHRGVFLSYYLNGPKRYDIAKVAQGDTVAHLYPSQLKKLVVSLPSEAEQQRIASCLSSLDELITNENNKLETYKTHKKGLMQGLFPNVGEGDA